MKTDLKTMIDVMGMGVWQEGKLGIVLSTYLPTKDMDDKQIRDNMKILKKAGFSPHLVDAGGENGKVIQMSGADNLNLFFMRRMLIAQEKWESAKTTGGDYVSRVATRGMEFDHMRALHNALKGEHMEGLTLQSKTLGPTVRVEGFDVIKLEEIKQKFSPDKVKLIEKPKPQLGKDVLKAFNRVAAKVSKFVNGLKPKPAQKPLAPPDPKNFARIWQRDENGKLVDALRRPNPPSSMKPGGK